MRATLSLFAVLLVFESGFAQEPPRVREIVDVTVANIEVIVTDQNGARVRGLARDAFELLENGKPVRISNFAEIDENVILIESSPAPDAVTPAPAEAAAQRAAPVRRVVVFLDLATVSGIRRRNALKSVAEFLDQLGPGDERMIVSWNDAALAIEVPPEADRETEKKTLEELVRRKPERIRNRDFSITTRIRQAIVTYRRNHLHRSVLAVRAMLAQMKALDGRKVLILVTAGFPLRPGREIMVGPNFDADTHAVKLYDGFVVEARKMLDSLGQAANAAGVTLYTIHGLGATARVAVGAHHVEDGSGMGPATNQILPGIGVDPNYVQNSVSGLTVLAEKSGGTVTAGTNDLRSAFREIREDLASYYSLGYHLSGALDAERNVEVRMRDPKLTARARTSVVVRPVEGEAEDAVVSSLALPESPWGGAGPANELGIAATAGAAKRTSRGRKLTVEVRIPLAALSWDEEGDGLVANIVLLIGAADAEKTLTDVEKFEHTIRVPPGSLETEGAYYTYVFDVDLRTPTAENDLAVAVVDEGSGLTGHAVVKIGTPKPN